MLLKSVHPNVGYRSELIYPKVRYDIYSKFLPPFVSPTLYSEMGMFEAFVKGIKKNTGDGTKAYLVHKRDEDL